MIRFLHCADLHLDSPLSALDPRRAQARQNEIRGAFTSLTFLAKNYNIDFLLIAGDLFDSEYVTKDTISLIRREFASMPDCKVIIAPGNHDPYTPQSFYRRADFPENVFIFDSEELSMFDFPEKNTSIYGYAFTSPILDHCPFENLHPSDKGRINILLAHGEVGKTSSDNCPIPNEVIASSGFDYIALGHYHEYSGAKKLGETYYAYSGCLDGRGFDETGEKGAIVCAVEKDSENGLNLATKFHCFSKRRYEVAKLDVSGARSNPDVVGMLAGLIAEKRFGEETALRVTLTGKVGGDFRISEDFIQKQFPQLFMLKLIDKTSPLLEMDQLERDPTIRGAFYRSLRGMLESPDENERETAAAALRYGLAAISQGGEITDL